MRNVDLNFYPGWVRKAISFSIDDGKLALDKKFIDIVKPAGIKGTFNLISSSITENNKADYLAQYDEYEIANHMKYHPQGLRDGEQVRLADEEFNPETADVKMHYRSKDKPEIFFFAYRGRWLPMTDDENYIKLVNEGKAELEAVFGEGRVKDFVWPYGKQREELRVRVAALGYRSIRIARIIDGFDLPKDRTDWGLYADCNNLTEKGESFESLADDGKLKALIFGVHSSDFENAGKWDVLRDFCSKYGNRPGDFYYATVGDIFDTEDAIKSAELSENELINHSSRDMYIMLDGEKKVLRAGECLKL